MNKKVFSHILIFIVIVLGTILFSVDVKADGYSECLYQQSGVDITITSENSSLDYKFDPPEYGLAFSNVEPINFENVPVQEGNCPMLYIGCSTERVMGVPDYVLNGITMGNYGLISAPFGEYVHQCTVSSYDDNNMLHEDIPFFGDDLPALYETFGFDLESGESPPIDEDINNTFDCEGDNGILGNKEDEESVAWLIVRFLDYIKVLGPSAMLLLTGIDYIRIILLGDDELSKKMNKRLVIRFICLVLLFFVPMLVELLLDLFGITGCSSIY